jgi:predicted nucleic acid-binding protein
MTPILIDSSAVISAVLERGLSKRDQRALTASPALMVSRLALVETARALYRAEAEKRVTAVERVRALGEASDLWARCEIWELSRSVCAEAMTLAPQAGLRTLDALHLATFLAVRKRANDVRLLSTDARMLEAARALRIRTV